MGRRAVEAVTPAACDLRLKPFLARGTNGRQILHCQSRGTKPCSSFPRSLLERVGRLWGSNRIGEHDDALVRNTVCVDTRAFEVAQTRRDIAPVQVEAPCVETPALHPREVTQEWAG